MSFKKIVSFVLVVLTLTACSTALSYNEPNPASSPVALATVQGYFAREGILASRSAVVTSIDNKDCTTLLGGSNHQTYVTPGPHLFVVTASIARPNLLSGPGQFGAILDLTATLKPGQHYHLNGYVNGARVYVWMEDQNGQRVSKIAVRNYSAIQTDPVFMPMVMPSK